MSPEDYKKHGEEFRRRSSIHSVRRKEIVQKVAEFLSAFYDLSSLELKSSRRKEACLARSMGYYVLGEIGVFQRDILDFFGVSRQSYSKGRNKIQKALQEGKLTAIAEKNIVFMIAQVKQDYDKELIKIITHE